MTGAVEATDLFLSLQPEKVLQAVEAAGLSTRPVCYPLNSFENRVYEVELEDRTRVIAKFYRPGRWSREQILEEHRLLTDLDAEEIPVGTVRPFPDGDTLHRIDHIFYALFDRRGGRAPDELDDPAALRLGRLVGRLHTVAARRPAATRPRLAADTYVGENLAWLESHDTVPASYRGRYFAAAEAIAALADELMTGVETHRLHGDLHLGNLLDRDGLLTLVDFDDMVVGPAVQDLWLALPGRDRWTLRQREIFLEGYESFRLFDRATLRLIEPLRGLRLVHYATWLARRWHDPAFPAAWPHFGTDEYWQGETEALEEVVGFIRGERRARETDQAIAKGKAPDEADEEGGEAELSNKDYFWDWEED